MPSLPDNKQPCDSHLAALVAINIVTQVLDEAEDILLAAHSSGQPWRYVWRQKKGNGEFEKGGFENAEIFRVLDINVDDNAANNSEIIQIDNMIVTSTPQKEIGVLGYPTTKTYNENSFIGQGDEDIRMRNTDLKSPSMLIDCLFDMSTVEQADNNKVLDDIQMQNSTDFLISTVGKLVESYVNLALNAVCGDITISEHQMVTDNIEVGSSHSSYSLLTDALPSDDTENENATYFIENVKTEEYKHKYEETVNREESKIITTKDIDLYEKTFLTLNRDYDKCSEEEYFIPDGRSLTLQEVELKTNKSSENLATASDNPCILRNDPSAAVEVHKNSLVKRCRLQGAKLMSRLRSWWWNQRLVGKRKGCRSRICALSPQARRLGASLLDHRNLRSPSPTRGNAWKFNTVNEALVHSYNTKDNEVKTKISDPVETD